MIHAGVLFWHVRRFSANAFYEPAGVALATLALWAFSFANEVTKQNETRQRYPADQAQTQAQARNQDQEIIRADDSSSTEEDMLTCNIILIDRPTDDELVQRFVRKGHTMMANMDGVGDLYGPQGAVLVLQQGRRILQSLRWGDRKRWINLFARLQQVVQRKRI